MNKIYYFTGTGNSLKTAKDIAEKLGETELIPIASLEDEDTIEITGERVGFVFPVYMFGLPLIIKRFAKKLQFTGEPYLFAITTCGGLAGLTLHELNDILQKKGTGLSAGFIITLPGNYTPLYGAKSDEKIEELISKEEERIDEIADIIKNKKLHEIEKNNFFLNFLFSKIIRYFSIGKIHTMDKDFWVKENCTSCGTCVDVCPVENITLEDGKPKWHHRCEQCVACLQYCPVEAIQLGKKTEERKRYRNPYIDVSEIIAQRP